MACRLLIKNLPNRYATGDVIGVFPESHVFGRMESKARFIEAGNAAEDWHRHFVIVNVSDADMADFVHLLEQDDEGNHLRYLEPQTDPNGPYYPTLLEYAEITTTKAVVDSLVRVH